MSVETQVLRTLRFCATDSFETVIADIFGVSESAACVAIHRVSNSIASHKDDYIHMPRNESEIDSVHETIFFQISEFPSTLGAIDGCHVRIVCPSKDKAQTFYNRKAFYSINVQFSCDAELKFMMLWQDGLGRRTMLGFLIIAI